MDKIIEILEELVPGVDFHNKTGLASDGVIPSLLLLNLISELEDEFDIDIDISDVVMENFDSVEAIWDLVQEYQEKD